MGFLGLAFLAALPLAAAPILLHLFDRRRNVVIEWGAMEFLLEAASQKSAARRVKQWLLVALRVLTVLVLILALARPMLRGNWFGSAARTETIYVLDNSMSMQRGDDEQTVFKQAIAKVVESIESLPDGDSVRLLLTSPYPVWITQTSVRIDSKSREQLIELVGGLSAGDGSSDLLSAMFTAVQLERPMTESQRTIVVLSDGQRSDWTFDEDESWKRLLETVAAAAIPTELEIVDLDDNSSTNKNLAVNRIEANRTVIGVDQPFTLAAEVQNYGDLNSSATTLDWTIAGDEQQTSSVASVPPGGVQKVQWQHSFAKTGVYEVSCKLASDDELAADDRATVVIEVVNKVPFLLVESSPELSEFQRDAFFFETSLGWIDGQAQPGSSVMTPRMIEPQMLDSLDLTGERAVVIPHLQSLSEESVRRLQDFVFAGGGLWIALGPRTDANTFNQLLFAEGNGLAPLAIDQILDRNIAESDANEDEGRPEPTRINPFQQPHPATENLTDTEKLDTGEIVVSQHWNFVTSSGQNDVGTLLSLTDGKPLVVEKSYGNGRVIVQAIPLRFQWSELARSQAFVVMVRDWLDYLAQPKATSHNLLPGDPLVVEFEDDGLRNATLHTPLGDEIELTADVRGNRVLFQTSRTILPGAYRMELGTTGTEIPFHVNRDQRESDLTRLTAQDQNRLAELAAVEQSIEENETETAGHSEPVWPMLLVILIVLISAELLLSGMISRERFGGAALSETNQVAAPAIGPLPVVANRERQATHEPETAGAGANSER